MIGTLTIVLAGCLLGSDTPKEDHAKKELEKLRGTWVITANTQEGKETPELLREVKRYTIKGDRYSVSFKGAENPLLEFRLKLGGTSKPKTIDLVGLNSDKVFLMGIYELEGDTLKICVPVGNSGRPKEIKSETGSKSGIIVYKRLKE